MTALGTVYPFIRRWAETMTSRTYTLLPEILAPLICMLLLAVGLVIMIRICPLHRRAWPFHTIVFFVNLLLSWGLFRFGIILPSINFFLCLIFLTLCLWSFLYKEAA